MSIVTADGEVFENGAQYLSARHPPVTSTKKAIKQNTGIADKRAIGISGWPVYNYGKELETEPYQDSVNFLQNLNTGIGAHYKPPSSEDEGSENIQDRRAPVYNRSLEQEAAKRRVGKDTLGIFIGEKTGLPSIPVMRHGKTIENKNNTAHGWSDEPLIKEGREEVEKTADSLKSNPPTLIAHSDLKRASESAKIVADKTGAKLLSIPNLRTWDIGNFEGKECGECEKELKYYVDNPDKKVPGGEPFNTFKTRVQAGLQEAISKGADMIVTHNKTERMIAALEKSENPHEVFSHAGGPEPGQMRELKLG